MKIKCMLDVKKFTNKPQGAEIAAVQIRMAKTEIEISELADLLSQGASFKPAAMDGKTSDTWISQQLFALDFDHDATIDDTLARCQSLGIMPAFGYTSFSHDVDDVYDRFRLVFVCNTNITDIRIRNAVQFALLTLFPKADQVTKDAARLFFGGKSPIKCDINSQFDVYNVIQSMVATLKNEDSKNANRNISNYCAAAGLNMINGIPDIKLIFDNSDNDAKLTEMCPVLYIYIEVDVKSSKTIALNFNIDIDDALKSTNNTKKINIKHNIGKNKKTYETIKYFDFDSLKNKCQLYNDFLGGNRWCYHAEIFGMATSLCSIRGGEKRMLDAINNNNSYNNKNHLTNTIKATGLYGYAPMRCANFCPYVATCDRNGVNMLQQVDSKRGEVRQIEDIEAKDLAEAEIELLEAITTAYEADDNKVYVIKAPTGIGKTTALGTLGDLRNTIIAYPNHKLGTDIIDRLDIKKAVHVKKLEIKDEEISAEFQRLQSIGAYGKARTLLDNHMNNLVVSNAAGTPERDAALEDATAIANYFEAVKAARTTSNPIFCTHARMMDLNNVNTKTIIIDEDVMLSSIIQTVPLDLTTIKATEGLALSVGADYVAGCMATLRQKVESAMEKVGQVQDMPALMIREKEIKTMTDEFSSRLKINILDVLKIRKLVSNSNGDVIGICIDELPNKKCIIMSATANETIYKKILKNREIVFIDLGNIKTQGQLMLHPTAFSRYALTQKFDKAIKKIKEESANITNLITFARFENQFIKKGFNAIAHFGACQGLDAYKGQDLIVAGTPHIDERVYMLIAASIKPDVIIYDAIDYVLCRRNGFEFYFNTYSAAPQTPTGQLLQEIQMYLIESELIQAIGRARILRTDATVHLYSNLPIAGCQIYK